MPGLTYLVGECNPHSADPGDVLSPERPGSAGNRLWAMLYLRHSMTRDDYLRGFRRVNLCSTEWDAEAAETAADIMISSFSFGDRVVMLGAKVASAFCLRRAPKFEWEWASPAGSESFKFLKLPHPSGLCRDYNDPATRDRAADLLHDEALRGLGLYAFAGEFVTCEAGHSVSRFVCDIPVKTPLGVKSEWFELFAEGAESIHVKRAGHEWRCGCGALWARAVEPGPGQSAALKIHVGREWR
jgi:hypothetical protein